MTMLPDEFRNLEPFATAWCLATETERWNQRHASTMAELTEFYEVAFPCVEAAIDHCDRYPLDNLPPAETNLLRLVHSLVVVAMAVEVFAQPNTVDAADAMLERVREPAP